MRKNWLLMLVVAVIAGFAQQAAAQAVTIQGKVDCYTLSSGGLLNGFLLDDGTEVHFSASFSKQLGHAVRRGEPVLIHGQFVPGVHVVIASSVTGQVSHETVVDTGSVGFDESNKGVGIQGASATGIVKQLLHGRLGQVNGALFDTGLMVRMPPNVPVSRPELFVVGMQMAVSGDEFDTGYGRVIRISSMGNSDSELSPVRQIGLEMPEPNR